MDMNTEEQLSDDEIFIGKLSLKEIKKRVLWNKQRDNKYFEPIEKEEDRSLKLIETHSEPDMLHKDTKPIRESSHLKATSNPVLSPLSSPNPLLDNKPSDDSFMRIEKMVTDLCGSTQENNSVTLDNTLDVIDYILKNGPAQNYDNTDSNKKDDNKHNELEDQLEKLHFNHVTPKVAQLSHTPGKSKDSQKENKTPFNTPSKTHMKYNKTEQFDTPCSNLNTPVFKTPGNPVSCKKTPHSSLKKPLTRTKLNIYKHIASPVASYINNCPIVPLIKDVRPTKPLPGHSSIPKFVKSTHKPSNKENVNLPAVAYKSAKKTEVINVPDEQKLPQCQWVKKISSLPRPLVLKHDHREMNIAKRMFMSKHEDSIADLSLKQADLSVCTQKTAFHRPKKN